MLFIIGYAIFYQKNVGEGPGGFDLGSWVPCDGLDWPKILSTTVNNMIAQDPEQTLMIEPRESTPRWAEKKTHQTELELQHSDDKCTCPRSITKHSVGCPLYLKGAE